MSSDDDITHYAVVQKAERQYSSRVDLAELCKSTQKYASSKLAYLRILRY